jgi:hypothetical protein
VRNPRLHASLFTAIILSTFSGSVSGQTAKVSPSGPIPHTLDGKPDLSGLWDHPFVIDMGKDGRNDPAKYDATGHCNPMGYTRSMNAPVPTEIVQTPKEVVFLHESMFAFHVVYLDGRAHPSADDAIETKWYGHSTGHWDGDTLVVDTVGPFFETPKMLLDTAGHPVSENMHIVERYHRIDATHLGYEVTVTDPKMYTKPFTNVRTWVLMPKTEEVLEYVCTENNKEVDEHHIK